MAYNKETKMWEGYIYKITNDINEKIYIGQTCVTIKDRWYGHKYQIKDHEYTDKLHNAMLLYGIENFHIEPINKYESESKIELIKLLNAEEVRYIDEFNSYKNGYNSTLGGRDAIVTSQRKVEQYSLDGEYIQTYNGVNELLEVYDSVSCIYDNCLHPDKIKYAYGHIWKYSDSNYQLPKLTDDEKEEAILKTRMRNKIIEYDYKGNIIKEYKNANDVLENSDNDITRRQLLECCSGKKNPVINFRVYRFFDDEFNKYNINRIKPRMVEQYDIDNNFINVYKSAREAARITGLDNNCIAACARGKYSHSGGYIWKYV